MKRNSIRAVIVLGIISIIGVFIIQIYWIRKAWNINEKQFNQTIHVALQNIAEQIAQYNKSILPTYDLIIQLTSNYYVVNIESEIDAELLDFFLRKEFKTLHLNTDFEYGIYDCSTDEMVYGKYINPDGEIQTDEKAKFLPKCDEFTYYFGIRFPSRTKYLIQEMNIWIVFSLILLLTIVFFGYAMFTILQQKRLSELQKDFINNMTHEFKTPISTIHISTNVILSSEIHKTPLRLEKYAKIIKTQNERLNNQVERVLQINRIDRKSFQIKKEPVDVEEIIDDIRTNYNLRIKELNGKLSINNTAKGVKIYADKVHFANIIYNLVDNAIKYSPENPEIKINIEKTKENFIISVIDKGIGIENEYKKKVFKKFFRVPTGNRHDVKGFGLGLYYVMNICKLHKWSIHLVSKIGKGSKFSVFIPVKKLSL